MRPRRRRGRRGPRGCPGRHCSPQASIACDARVSEATLRGGSVAVELARLDKFTGRCAGKVTLRRGKSSPGRAVGRFNFGALPPPEGPASRTVKLGLGPQLRDHLTPGGGVHVVVRPFSAFARTDRLKLD